MFDADDFRSVCDYLRDEYKTKLEDLQQVRRDAFASATEEVKLTSVSHEGGGGGGVIAFNKRILLAACNQVIAELTNGTQEKAAGFVIQFSQ